MTFNVPIEFEDPKVVIQLPADWPLLEDLEGAAKRFSISVGTLNKLRRQPGFPVTHAGAKVLIDIPAAYAWFQGYHGQAIPLD